MQRTDINYLTHSWNPIGMKCDPVSLGCANCWHLAMVKRFGLKNPGLREKELTSPARLRKPAKIGGQFMGDLFHKDVPFEFIDKVMAVIALCPQHEFYILTKRIERAKNYYSRPSVLQNTEFLRKSFPNVSPNLTLYWPFPNLYLGTSICTQAEADKNIPILLSIPAAKRWVSVEPMLERISLSDYMGRQYGIGDKIYPYSYLDWLVIGCESGPHRRPCPIEWVENISEQCKAAGVKQWIKQLDLNGKCVEVITQFPEHLRIRERI